MDSESNPALMSDAARAGAARRGRRTLWVVAAALLGIAAGVGGTFLALRTQAPAPATTGRAALLYQCPMHPTITSDHPGDCPICGMKLVLVVASRGKAEQSSVKKGTVYQCPMHPTITSDHPGDCPICGMKLVLVPGSEGAGGAPARSGELAGGRTPGVEGRAAVTIDPFRQQAIGLRTVPVARGVVGGSWRTVGRVEVDPTRVRKINMKVEGFVERVFVDFEGRPVRKGEALFTLYSPSLLAAQNDFLLALRTRDALAGGGGLGGDGDALVSASRRRLELWDVPAQEIERLERTGQPTKALTFVSPLSGVVTAKGLVEGGRLAAGDTPYEITDLGVVWVMADAYETDLSRVATGMAATLTSPVYPGRSFKGRIAFVDPLLDPKSRTLKVHVHFPNPTGELKPGMYGEVLLEAATREGLRIPSDAVVRFGEKDVVFVALGGGRFEPRVVQLGLKSGDLVEVRGGLAEGQEVVTRATFLIDSESQLRASLAAIGGK